MHRVDVYRIPTAAPDDTAGLTSLIEGGALDPRDIVCVLGKTEGNGCVNDFSRGLATMAYKAIDQGAAGVDMGRNIFQSEHPVAMIQAVGAVVHRNEKPQRAYQLYQQIKAGDVPDRSRLARSA